MAILMDDRQNLGFTGSGRDLLKYLLKVFLPNGRLSHLENRGASHLRKLRPGGNGVIDQGIYQKQTLLYVGRVNDSATTRRRSPHPITLRKRNSPGHPRASPAVSLTQFSTTTYRKLNLRNAPSSEASAPTIAARGTQKMNLKPNVTCR